MIVNPYETPGEPKPHLDDKRQNVSGHVEQRLGFGLLRACSVVVGVGAGALLGMAVTLIYAARTLNTAYFVTNSLWSIVLIGGASGAVVSLASIFVLRSWTNAIRRKVNISSAQHDGRKLSS